VISGTSSGAGSGALTVSYADLTPDDCGAAEFTIAGSIGVTVDAGLTGAEFAAAYAFTICSDETLDIDSLVMITPYYGGVAGTDITLTQFLAIPGTSMTKNGDSSFSLNGTVISGTSSGAGSGALTVSYADLTPDDCGAAEFTIAGSIGVTVEQCLDCFVLNVKLGDETHTYTQDYFEPNGLLKPGKIYVVNEDFSNASKFQFMFNCPPGSLEYNYYRGLKCGGSWESGEDPLTQPVSSDPPPVWLTNTLLKNGVFYPAKLSQGLQLCQKGGNILKIRVNKNNDLVFTFELGRNIE